MREIMEGMEPTQYELDFFGDLSRGEELRKLYGIPDPYYIETLSEIRRNRRDNTTKLMEG